MFRLLTPTATKFRLLAEIAPDEGHDELVALAQCFLNDPRDSVEAVYIWDGDSQQFRGVIRRQVGSDAKTPVQP